METKTIKEITVGQLFEMNRDQVLALAEQVCATLQTKHGDELKEYCILHDIIISVFYSKKREYK